MSACEVCQRVKLKHQKPAKMLNLLPIPKWKWENVAMDFVGGLLIAFNRYDSIWVIVDRLTKTAYFIPVRANYSVDKLAQVYVAKIIRLHRALVTIISNRGPQFTSRIRITPYEAMCERKCRPPVCWKEVGERALARMELVEITNQAMPLIRKRSKTAAGRQKSYADLHRREVVFKERDMVVPKLALPPKMERIHPLFHISMLRKFVLDLNKVISEPDMKILEDLSYVEERIWIEDMHIRKLRNKEIPIVKLLLNHHNMEECP
ncbi:uncharacterized protein LOC131180084 [Hevea brasiliensis]|uniref:uncharacterized protein LOC131180084 n=1 Tax=Hevea brasiliensis TaxID=3981 RepID=UPI0025EACB38|nr:uncharacterized protein LOC131180084 [Hevea brasiliensis]